jgi:GAF domain-containing protein
MEPENRQIAAVMAQVAQQLESGVDVEETLNLITQSAVETIPAVDWASISVTDKTGRIETLAPTDELARQVDDVQYDLRQGPCVQAALEEQIVVVEDLCEDQRWPDYGGKAVGLGLRSQLAFQFQSVHQPRGALNLYSQTPKAFGSDDILLAGMFASHVAVAMGWSRHEEELNEAIGTRKVIGQAIGLVMERYRLDEGRAFSFLLRVSQTENIKLRLVAKDLVAQANERAASGATENGSTG